jgi:hypothetical protein
MITKSIQPLSDIAESFSRILTSLTGKEREVIARRIGLSSARETLQSIGEHYGITRERVRQIEDVGIKKIGRIVKMTDLVRIQEVGEKILSLHGGLLSKDALVSATVKTLEIKDLSHLNIIEIILQSDFNIQKSKPQLGSHPYFYFPSLNKKLIHDIHNEAVRILKKRSSIMECEILYEMIKINLSHTYGKINSILIGSIMDVHLDIVKGEEKFIGLEKWKILNPSTLKEKAIYIFKKIKKPMHFVDLSNEISNRFGESVKVATIHNELIRNNEFVLIGRGIYVLKEWGYKSGTVLDVIVDIFNRVKTPLSTEEITSRVLRVRQVKPSTIYLNLQNRQHFERV